MHPNRLGIVVGGAADKIGVEVGDCQVEGAKRFGSDAQRNNFGPAFVAIEQTVAGFQVLRVDPSAAPAPYRSIALVRT